MSFGNSLHVILATEDAQLAGDMTRKSYLEEPSNYKER